jgi:transcriptional regulator with XRE-family HTH domain
MNINERIKEIRKAQNPKLNQLEFGNKMGISRDAISNIELGRVVPPESTIKLICATFGVSYAWLKDGIGMMILPPDTDEELVDKVMAGDNEYAKNIMKTFAKLNDDEWRLLKKIIDNIQK